MSQNIPEHSTSEVLPHKKQSGYSLWLRGFKLTLRSRYYFISHSNSHLPPNAWFCGISSALAERAWFYSICRVENPSICFCFSLFLFFKNILLSAGRMKFFKKIKKNNTIFCVENPSNYVAQHTWTDFQRNLGRIFNSTILLILGLFFLFEEVPKPLFL